MTLSLKEEVQEKLKNIERLPSFPEVVHKVLSLIRNPDVDFKDIAREIIKDPGLTSDIIRLSNSSYYHPVKEVRSIDEAIKILGLNTLKEIILVAAARGILKNPLEGYKLEGKDMWDHSILVAHISSNIALDIKSSKIPSDVAFTAGLMHDCGKIVLASTFKKAIFQIQQEYNKNPELSFTFLEKKYIGYTHPEIGAFLLKKWNFPAELVDAVLYIYQPENSKKNKELTSIIHIANWIAVSSGVGIDSMGMNENLSQFALQELKFSEEKIQHYYESVPEIIEKIKDLMEL